MTSEELKKYQKELKVSPDKIIREEAEMFFLNELADSFLGAKVIFYGGTALRLAYDSPRFSEDIDLLLVKPARFVEFKKFIEETVKKNFNWRLKDIKNKRQTWFALIIIRDEKLKHNLSLKIEVHKPSKKVDLKTEVSLIKSPVSIFSPLLLTPTLAEMEKLKIAAAKNRKKARDVFDLWYLAQKQRKEFKLDFEISFSSAKQFKNELRVFLPPKYYQVIDQLYEKVNR